MNKRVAFLLPVCALIFSLTTAAQGPGSITMDGQEQKKFIDSVGYLLIHNYIYPDVAKKMNDHLQENYKNAVYTSTTSVASFAEKLTSDLRSISKDKHLRVSFNPNTAAQMKKGCKYRLN